MSRFLFIMLFGVVFCGVGAVAQTPQQLEMLQKRQGTVPAQGVVYYDEQAQRFVIPENTNEPTIQTDEGEMVPLPMPKSDAELMATRRGPRSDYWSKMNDEEKKKYMDYLIADRIVVSVSDWQIITSPTGMKMCQMNLNVFNNTPRTLKKLNVSYKWGETSTFGEFSDVEAVGMATQPIAMAGSVCERVTKAQAEYDIRICQMEGLTQDQCKMRIAKQ